MNQQYLPTRAELKLQMLVTSIVVISILSSVKLFIYNSFL